ncbi:hypothetical protein QBC36DRAFT_318196 [Triangularia setosa]|uniref:CENP-V/GFA domain-containing protein n=1 Tax=Triangularia setosa TaxID=2587417 RepID=A0AAN6WH08_9PEZI|nr:hypothetical protein QBC36DRAFT_318196 [Podospora setosa]
MNASCQCGSIRFKTPLPKPLALYICHCVSCQRQTSSAFGVSAIFPRFSLPAQLQLQSSNSPTSSLSTSPETMTSPSSPPTCDGSGGGNGSSLLSVYSRPTANGQTLYCYFCKRCGTRLVHATPNKNVVSVKGGCLEGLDWKSAIHIWYVKLASPIRLKWKGGEKRGANECKQITRTKSAMVPIPEGVESHSEECSEPEYGVSQEELDQPGGLCG